MNSKVKELVEWMRMEIYTEITPISEVGGVKLIKAVDRMVKRILSHPDLALIDRELLPADVTFGKSFKARVRYPSIPLAEALKEE